MKVLEISYGNEFNEMFCALSFEDVLKAKVITVNVIASQLEVGCDYTLFEIEPEFVSVDDERSVGEWKDENGNVHGILPDARFYARLLEFENVSEEFFDYIKYEFIDGMFGQDGEPISFDKNIYLIKE